MFDYRSGYLRLGKLTIRPHIKYDVVKRNLADSDIISCEKGNTINLLIKPQQEGNRFFLVRLFFSCDDKKLEFCQISIQSNADIPTWDGWSRERETLKKNENDKWLKEETGNINFNYSWGSVRSIFNELEASSYIVINFACPN